MMEKQILHLNLLSQVNLLKRGGVMSLQEFCQGVTSLELILGKKVHTYDRFFYDNSVRICVLDI